MEIFALVLRICINCHNSNSTLILRLRSFKFYIMEGMETANDTCTYMNKCVENQHANRNSSPPYLWNSLKLNQYLSSTSEMGLISSLSVSEFHQSYHTLVQPALAQGQLHTCKHTRRQTHTHQAKHKALPT